MSDRPRVFLSQFLCKLFSVYAIIIAFAFLIFHMVKSSKKFEPSQTVQFEKINIDTNISFNK